MGLVGCPGNGSYRLSESESCTLSVEEIADIPSLFRALPRQWLLVPGVAACTGLRHSVQSTERVAPDTNLESRPLPYGPSVDS